MSKKEEKLRLRIRAVGKKKANRQCFSCEKRGPQCICVNYNLFICMQCSGLHREVGHSIKTISMSRFTPAEVKAIEEGGNDVAAKQYLATFKSSDFARPDRTVADTVRNKKVKEFIELTFNEQRWVAKKKEE